MNFLKKYFLPIAIGMICSPGSVFANEINITFRSLNNLVPNEASKLPSAGDKLHIAWNPSRVASCSPNGDQVRLDGRFFDHQGKIINSDLSAHPLSFTLDPSRSKPGTEFGDFGDTPVIYSLFELQIPLEADRLELWFHEKNCDRYDSNNGSNFVIGLNHVPPLRGGYRCNQNTGTRAELPFIQIFRQGCVLKIEANQVKATQLQKTAGEPNLFSIFGTVKFSENEYSFYFPQQGSPDFVRITPQFNEDILLEHNDGSANYCRH